MAEVGGEIWAGDSWLDFTRQRGAGKRTKSARPSELANGAGGAPSAGRVGCDDCGTDATVIGNYEPSRQRKQTPSRSKARPQWAQPMPAQGCAGGVVKSGAPSNWAWVPLGGTRFDGATSLFAGAGNQHTNYQKLRACSTSGGVRAQEILVSRWDYWVLACPLSSRSTFFHAQTTPNTELP